GGTGARKDGVSGLGCDAITRRILDRIPRQCGQVCDIGEKIKGDDENRAERERQRMFRRGSFTSPAVKVMLFQASAEKSELVCATQMPTNRPKAVAAVSPAPTSCKPPRKVQKSLKFSAPAPDFTPTIMPSKMSAMSAPVLAV